MWVSPIEFRDFTADPRCPATSLHATERQTRRFRVRPPIPSLVMTMRQLVLDMGLAPVPSLDNFVAGRNAGLLEHLRVW